MKHTKLTFLILSIFLFTQPALAISTVLTGNPFTDGIISTLIYSGIGIVMAFVAFKVCDILTPGDLSGQISENNTALAIVAGCSMLGVCIIIAAAIAG